MARMRKAYRRTGVLLKLHPHVRDLLVEQAAAEGLENSAYITAIVAAKAGKKVEDLLVPDNNQEVLPQAV